MEINKIEKGTDFNTVNDINDVFDINELNLDLTHLSDHILLGTETKYTYGTIDINKKLNKNINLSLNKKIYIKTIKTKNFDCINNKNFGKNNINLNNNNPKIGDYILDSRLLDKIKNDGNIYSDIYKPKLSLKTQLIKKINILYLKILKLFSLIIKPILYISIFIFIFGLYFYTIESNIKSGFNYINDINMSDDLDLIFEKIEKSNNDLIFAKKLYIPISLINNLFDIGLLNNIDYLLDGGTGITEAGILSLKSINDTKKLISNKSINEISYSDLINNFKPIFSKINSNINSSLINFKQIDFNDEYINGKLIKVIDLLSNVKIYSNLLFDNYDSILGLLGHEESKKYIVLLQNSDEIRSTGGFIGSLGEIDIFRGKIKDFTTRDVYSYEWDIKPYRELPPEGINRITDNFGLRDSNYYIEYKDNSEKIKFFLDKANINIDGVFYFNLVLIEDILNLIGGVYFDEIDKDITGDNFSTIISVLVEAKIYKSGTLISPKTILFTFIEEFKNKLLNYKNKDEILKLVLKNVKNGELVFNSFDIDEYKVLKLLGVNGIKDYESSIDFNYPIFTSVGGNKSDRFIDIKFTKDVKTNDDCTIDTSLNIGLHHTFSSNDEVSIKELFYNFGINEFKNYEDLMNIQGRGLNKQYIRLVLPKDSIIENGEILNEKRLGNYKIVSFYLNTYPQEKKNFIIKYKLPNYSCNNYSYTFYKQAGIRKYDLDFKLNNNLTFKSGLIGNFEY